MSLEREHRISGFINLKSVMYTGKEVNVIKSGGFYHVIHKSSKQEIKLDIPFNEYYKLLDHQVKIIHTYIIYAYSRVKLLYFRIK